MLFQFTKEKRTDIGVVSLQVVRLNTTELLHGIQPIMLIVSIKAMPPMLTQLFSLQDKREFISETTQVESIEEILLKTTKILQELMLQSMLSTRPNGITLETL